MIELKEKEKLNPQESTKNRTKFPERFDCTDTLLTKTEKQATEDILVEYHDIFARHRMDSGMNTEFKVKLTPKDDKAVYSQSLPLPIHLKDDLIVELALMHKYGIITVLPFSKYASHIFAKRKPNGKIHLLLDLRKINKLIAEDYTNNNYPVSTLSEAAKHLTKNSLICRLDCSQTCHCLQMAEQGSMEIENACIQENLPTKALQKFSADMFLPFQVSCASTWTQLSKLANVPSTWTFELQSTMLQT